MSDEEQAFTSSDRIDERIPILRSPSNDSDYGTPHRPVWNYQSSNDADFQAAVQQARQAIEQDVLPERIAAGSSGSYFVKNLDDVS